jgi:hypothetical protein
MTDSIPRRHDPVLKVADRTVGKWNRGFLSLSLPEAGWGAIVGHAHSPWSCPRRNLLRLSPQTVISHRDVASARKHAS